MLLGKAEVKLMQASDLCHMIMVFLSILTEYSPFFKYVAILKEICAQRVQFWVFQVSWLYV